MLGPATVRGAVAAVPPGRRRVARGLPRIPPRGCPPRRVAAGALADRPCRAATVHSTASDVRRGAGSDGGRRWRPCRAAGAPPAPLGGARTSTGSRPWRLPADPWRSKPSGWCAARCSGFAPDGLGRFRRDPGPGRALVVRRRVAAPSPSSSADGPPRPSGWCAGGCRQPLRRAPLPRAASPRRPGQPPRSAPARWHSCSCWPRATTGADPTPLRGGGPWQPAAPRTSALYRELLAGGLRGGAPARL